MNIVALSLFLSNNKKKKEKLKIPLEDQEYIEGFMGMSYRKIYSLMALLINQTEDQLKKTKMKLEIVKSNGCDTYFRLAKLDEMSLDSEWEMIYSVIWSKEYKSLLHPTQKTKMTPATNSMCNLYSHR